MWQTVAVVIVVGLAVGYVVWHFVRLLRKPIDCCDSGCPDCCSTCEGCPWGEQKGEITRCEKKKS